MAKARSRDNHPHVGLNELSPWELTEQDISPLLSAADDPRLKALFGDDYDELVELARQSQRTVRASGPRVLLIPGILGSSIGKPGNFLTRDTIWFDPTSLLRGDVVKLKLAANGASSLTSLDVIPVVHAYLYLRLKMKGFRVEYYHYDWRQSLVTLGKQLSRFVAGQKEKLSIVAHSMGGLVTRAALKAGADNVDRVVLLGTPNQGSFAAVEVLQGINSNVVLVDKLDPKHTAEELRDAVFSTFPSVYELLPRPAVFSQLDLFDPSKWPKRAWHPAAKRLADAQTTWSRLTDQDKRLHLIAGYGQSTVTDLSISADGSEFLYHLTQNGDGTVPLNMCILPSMKDDRTWYVEETHTGLLRNESVASATAELLASGTTSRLKRSPTASRAATVTLKGKDFLDNAERPELLGSRSGAAIDPTDLPLILEAAMSFSSVPTKQTLNDVRKSRLLNRVRPASEEPNSLSQSSGRLTSGIIFNQTVISRDHQSHLELELFNGNLFDVPYSALVLGIYSDVDPTGPARMLDALTGGAVSELIARRMFDADAGKVFVMPTGRNSLKADYVVFAGLGKYGQFAENTSGVLQTISCNILRTLMNCGVDEFATLVYGGSSGNSMRQSVESLVRGYMDALQALGSNEKSVRFRRVALCEQNAEKYAELKDEAYRIGGTDLCNDIRLRLHEARFPESAKYVAKAVDGHVDRLKERFPDSMVYLTVRFEKPEEEPDAWTCYASLLGAGSKASVFPGITQFDRDDLYAQLKILPDGTHGMTTGQMLKAGKAIRDLIFSRDFISVLDQSLTSRDHLAIITDAEASRIPWEILPLMASKAEIGNGCSPYPCLNAGVSRRFQTDGTNSLAKFLEERQRQEVLEVLLVVNPTEDLDGAEAEGERLEEILAGLELVRVRKLSGKLATKDAVLDGFGSGKYDVIHYAGHAFFDPANRGRSGLLCAGGTASQKYDVVTGRDLMELTRLPSLVFFNACESGRTRLRPNLSGKSQEKSAAEPALPDSRNNPSAVQTGVCEALLRGGISQFVGTYWPVGDAPAEVFAGSFYGSLLAGKTVRESVLDGRRSIASKIDAANYIHYGDPTFVVKDR